MDTLQEIIVWANANEGLLQALALLGLAGCALADLGYSERGLEACRAVAREDPSSHIPRVVLAVILVLLERHDEARASIEEARRLRSKIDFEELDTLVAHFGSVLENLWSELPAAEDAAR